MFKSNRFPTILLIVCLTILFLFFACHSKKSIVNKNVESSKPITEEVSKQRILKIATFNIQNFGKSKIAKPLIMDTLVSIIRNFDIIAVQEIADVSNQTAGKFLEMINENYPTKYKMVCSNRTGREYNDRTCAEQYAFYYKSSAVEIIDTSLYDDKKNDYFQCEPYIAQFRDRRSGQIFVITNIHTSPRFAVQEIAALFHVAEWIPTRFKNTENLIFCGDFNASCSYASTKELDEMDFRKPPFFWIVPDNANTNLSKNDCAYDRFVSNQEMKEKIKNWNVYRYFKTKAVSDHWPVYVEVEF